MLIDDIRLFCTLFGLQIALIPLLWGWIRGALLVLEKLSTGQEPLLRLSTWKLVLNLFSYLMLGSLIAASFSFGLCFYALVEGKVPLFLTVLFVLIVVVLHGLLFVAVASVVTEIGWILVEISDRWGY